MTKRFVFSVVSYFSAVLAVVLFFTTFSGCTQNLNNQDYINSSSAMPKKETLNIPVDFEKLYDINSDIYAWIYVPNTNIDYPVFQHSKNDGYYLHHNIYGKYEFAGTIYSEKKNSKDFSDPNTLLYGHNMTKGYMFENLHKFQDKTFFDENSEFYIYTPDKIYTYTIVSAFQHNDNHVLYEYDCTKQSGFEMYLELIKNPKYKIKNVREDIEISTDDRFVTLSTCLGNGKVYRYLVVGVLAAIESVE